LGGYLICLITTSSTLKNNLEKKEPAVLKFQKFSESKKLSSSSFWENVRIIQEPVRPQRTGGVHEINWLRTTSFTEGYLRRVSDFLRTGVLYRSQFSCY
jgi:hypothetical protein